jgi:hypothetical protein
MFLGRFDPSAIDPLFLVNRAEDLAWLTDAISMYLKDPSAKARGSLPFCILGEKGVGKTILTKAAVRKVRETFSDRAIFVEADCRHFPTARAVIDAIAKEVVAQLDELASGGVAVSDALMSTAQVLAEITRFEDVELKEVHQHLAQFKAATSLAGDHSLLRALKLDFKISLELSESTSRELTGKVRFDEMRLCRALGALFKDIRGSDVDVLLYLDNVDELAHHYAIPEAREKVRRDTETLLLLRDAPIIFIVNMRSYYSGILPREITNLRVLRRLGVPELNAILSKRLETERDEVKKAVTGEDQTKALAKIAAFAPTPLAFLRWFKFLFEADALSERGLAKGVTNFLETYYSALPVDVWRLVCDAFDKPETPIDRARLLTACGGNEAQLAQIIDRQGVLPKDFWQPATYYTLDPELYIAHRSAVGRDEA